MCFKKHGKGTAFYRKLAIFQQKNKNNMANRPLEERFAKA
jgi:hypothetical protein